MKKTASVILSIVMIMTLWIPYSFVCAADSAPQVAGWAVSSDHGGEVRGDNTDDQFITMIVTFDQEIQIADSQKAYNEFSVMLNNKIDITSQPAYTNGQEWPVYGSLKRGDDKKSVVFDLHYGYAPYASYLTIIPTGQITQITGTDGTPVVWKDVSMYFPNGVTFTTLEQIVGNSESNTPSSVTARVYAPSDSTRMMIHVLLLRNGLSAREPDSYGSNITTHFHDYLNLTAAGYANLFKGWFNGAFGNDYDILINGEEITVTSKTVNDGEVLDLRIYAYPQDRDTGADKTELNSAVSRAETFDPSGYTASSYQRMMDQAARAKAISSSMYYI